MLFWQNEQQVYCIRLFFHVQFQQQKTLITVLKGYMTSIIIMKDASVLSLKSE